MYYCDLKVFANHMSFERKDLVAAITTAEETAINIQNVKT